MRLARRPLSSQTTPPAGPGAVGLAWLAALLVFFSVLPAGGRDGLQPTAPAAVSAAAVAFVTAPLPHPAHVWIDGRAGLTESASEPGAESAGMPAVLSAEQRRRGLRTDLWHLPQTRGHVRRAGLRPPPQGPPAGRAGPSGPAANLRA